MDQGFPKQLRICRPEQFQALVQLGKKINNQSIRLIYQANQQADPRLGIQISKRFIAKAVARNRMKRVIRESFRQYKPKLSGYDMMIACRYKAELTNQELRLCLETLWQRLIKSSPRV